MSSASERGGVTPISRDWIVVLACLVCQIGMGAGGYLFPVFLKPIAEDLGWSRTTYSLANPVMSTTVALVGPIVGRLSDRIGPRVVLVAGSLLMSAALLGAGEMENIRDFYLVAVLVGLGVACLGDLPTAAAIAGRFQNRRGLALGTVYIGSNLGGAIAPLVATAIAATATWRGALTTMGSTLWLLLLPFALLAAAPRRAEESAGVGTSAEIGAGAQVPTDAEASGSPRGGASAPSGTGAASASVATTAALGPASDARTTAPSSSATARTGTNAAERRDARPEPVSHDAASALRQLDFWLLFWVVFVFYLYRLGVNTHLVAFLSDRGHSDQSAAGSFSAMLALGIAGKLLTGWLADRVGVWPATLGNFVLIAVASALLLVPDLPFAIPVFLALHGFATAAEDVVVPLVVGRRFGSLHLASIYGVMLLALVPGGSAGPLLAGWTFDSTGSYAAVFALFLAGNLSAVAALYVVRRHS